MSIENKLIFFCNSYSCLIFSFHIEFYHPLYPVNCLSNLKKYFGCIGNGEIKLILMKPHLLITSGLERNMALNTTICTKDIIKVFLAVNIKLSIVIFPPYKCLNFIAHYLTLWKLMKFNECYVLPLSEIMCLKIILPNSFHSVIFFFTAFCLQSPFKTLNRDLVPY